MKRLSFSKFLFAILLVGLGVLLLLVNTRIISLEINSAIVTFYPVVFVLLGLWLIFEPLITRHRVHWFWGLFFLIFGGLLIADRFQVITFHFWMMGRLWPLLLVYIGIKALSKGSYKKRRKKILKHEKGSTVFHMVKDITMNEPNWSVEAMELWYMVGDYDFDFSQAFIPDKNTEISLTGWVGDIKLLIPEDVPFLVEGYASVGDVKISGHKQEGIGKSIQYKTTDYDEATRKLTFHVDFKVLDLRIDRV